MSDAAKLRKAELVKRLATLIQMGYSEDEIRLGLAMLPKNFNATGIFKLGNIEKRAIFFRRDEDEQ